MKFTAAIASKPASGWSALGPSSQVPASSTSTSTPPASRPGARTSSSGQARSLYEVLQPVLPVILPAVASSCSLTDHPSAPTAR